MSRLGRALDLLALVLVLAGAGGYLVSYLGLERLRAAPEIAFARGMSIQQLDEYHRLVLISRWGLAAILTGIACGVFSWHRERRSNGILAHGRSLREHEKDAERQRTQRTE